jgi:glycosyltransferase involved in cell wall biosynthesis
MSADFDSRFGRGDASAAAPADVCLVVEGAYPFVSGGVSNWIDWLIRAQPERRFAVVALTADEAPLASRYAFPPNLTACARVPLGPRLGRAPRRSGPDIDAEELAATMVGVLRDGDADAFLALQALLAHPAPMRGWFARPHRLDLAELMGGRAFWRVLVACHRRIAPAASFPDFFWAWRFLAGGVFATLTAEIPRARAYHAISTGFAGLLAARAAHQAGAGFAITEHGVYTNERRIDIIMADWIVDTVEAGLGRDERADIRRAWIDAFESFARIAYARADRITTLYGENQSFQRALGAAEEKLEVIANGIDLERFAAAAAGPAAARPPTVALIGRVVPIKDVKAYIAAVAVMRRAAPGLRAFVLGPTDEDPEYCDQCRRLADRLGLRGALEFAGQVDVGEWLPRLDLVVLTSISEAQPLVLLEAGAASVPCVVTDVGSCREIVEGPADERPRLGSGGRVCPPMDAEAIGAAAVELLRDPALRRRCGETLRRRVERGFTSETSAARYGALYDRVCA